MFSHAWQSRIGAGDWFSSWKNHDWSAAHVVHILCVTLLPSGLCEVQEPRAQFQRLRNSPLNIQEYVFCAQRAESSANCKRGWNAIFTKLRINGVLLIQDRSRLLKRTGSSLKKHSKKPPGIKLTVSRSNMRAEPAGFIMPHTDSYTPLIGHRSRLGVSFVEIFYRIFS
jgi:hypothetical protein